MKAEGKNEPEDMRVRTKRYASAIVRLFILLPRCRAEVDILGRQLLRSGTSVAANYREACRSRSDAEFISKIETSTQEADESMLWLELLQDDCGLSEPEIRHLLQESDELLAILSTMARKVKNRRKE